MPTCSVCDNFYVGASCPYCSEEREKKAAQALELRRQREAFLFSTTDFVVGHQIVSHVGVVTGSVVLGTGMFSELRAGLSDALGAGSEAFARKMEEAKDDAFDRAYAHASAAGANAMIGVSIKYTRFSDNMIAAVVTGTAVVIAKNEQ